MNDDKPLENDRPLEDLKPVRLSAEQVAAIHRGLAEAGFAGLRVQSLHLAPVAPAPAAESDGRCHAVQMPDGHYKIVCS